MPKEKAEEKEEKSIPISEDERYMVGQIVGNSGIFIIDREAETTISVEEALKRLLNQMEKISKTISG